MRFPKMNKYIVSALSVLSLTVVFSFSCLTSSAADWKQNLTYHVNLNPSYFRGGAELSDGSYQTLSIGQAPPSEESPNRDEGWVYVHGQNYASYYEISFIIDLDDHNVRDVDVGSALQVAGIVGWSTAAGSPPSTNLVDITLRGYNSDGLSGDLSDSAALLNDSFTYYSDEASGVQTLGSQGMLAYKYDLMIQNSYYNDNGTVNLDVYDQIYIQFRFFPNGQTSNTNSWYPYFYCSPIDIIEYEDIDIYSFGSDMYDPDLGIQIQDGEADTQHLQDSIMNGFAELGIDPYDLTDIILVPTEGLGASFSKLKVFMSNFFPFLGSDVNYLFYFLIFVGAVALLLGVGPAVARIFTSLSSKSDKRK